MTRPNKNSVGIKRLGPFHAHNQLRVWLTPYPAFLAAAAGAVLANISAVMLSYQAMLS